MKKKIVWLLLTLLLVLAFSPMALATEYLNLTEQALTQEGYQIKMTTNDKTKELILTKQAIDIAIQNNKKFVVDMDYIKATIDPNQLITMPEYIEVEKSGEPTAVVFEFEVRNLNDANKFFSDTDQNYKGYYKQSDTCFGLNVYMQKGGITQKVIANFPAITVQCEYEWDRFQYNTGNLPDSALRYYWIDKDAALANSIYNWQYVTSSVNTKDKILSVAVDKSGVYMALAAKEVPGTGFSDITNHWAKDDITYLQTQNVIIDEGENFYPNTDITRAQFAAYVVRALGIANDSTVNNPYTDVEKSHSLYLEILAAYKSGIVQGVSATTFAPDAKITRQEMAVMFMRALSYANKAPSMDYGVLDNFTDKGQIASWAKDGATIAVNASLIGGTDGNRFAPLANATKGEAAAMLARLCRQL